MQKTKELLMRHKSAILYVMFGGLTTIINIAIYAICHYIFIIGNNTSNVIAWVVSVLFAYLTNKIYVFECKKTGYTSLLNELLLFFCGRLASGFLDILLMYYWVNVKNLPALIVKIIVNIIVIILNYLISKFVVFKKLEK